MPPQKTHPERQVPAVTQTAQGLPRITIQVGGLRASREPVVLDTVLGSCIAVCLYDPVIAAGGMNHFMLPEGASSENPTSARYGVYAMELLINELMKEGGDRRRFQAKVFGGGHVLRVQERLDSVPQQNIEFIRSFLITERIPVIKEDVGGCYPRRVVFYSHTGQAFRKRLGMVEAERTAEQERAYRARLGKQKLDGDATLF
ncbi:MAG: chemotaxis protein CheD [Acidiferrobacteraceae bacterium]